MKVFNLPDLGEGLPDAEIVRWLVKEGDTVKVDQPMVEMETAKAVVEVPSPFNGRISKLNGQAGDVIPVGAALVEFDGAESPTAPEQKADEKPARAKPISPKAAMAGSQVFKLPDLGEGLPDAEIVRWLVDQGDTVKVDQPMVEMETAKAVVEVPSPYAGTIARLHGQAGDVITVGAPLVEFGDVAGAGSSDAEPQDDSDAKPADAGTVVGSVQVGDQIVAESANAVVKALARKLKVDLTRVKGTGPEGKITQSDVRTAAASGASEDSVAAAPTDSADTGTATDNPLAYRASPAVRALARKLDVDLGRCQATGKKGSITRDDVQKASNGGASAPTRTRARTGDSGLPSVSVEVQPEAVRGVRRAMAMAMANSHANVVPTTLVEDADISAWRKGEDSLARYVRALVAGAKAVPALNAWFDGDKMERLLHPQVHVGIAIDSADGLYVPVVHGADRMNAGEVRGRVQELRDKIKSKSLKQDDQMGATITLSNYGSIAGRYGTPVVSPPQVAILGTGRFRNELQLTAKGIESHRMLPLSLSFDHRACTGGEAARFLAAIIEDLQAPS